MKWSRKHFEEMRWEGMSIEIDAFVDFLKLFRRTAPGVRYYVNCTEEQDADTHKQAAIHILETLRYIKRIDIYIYKAIVHLYKDDIRDIIAVYRQSMIEA